MLVTRYVDSPKRGSLCLDRIINCNSGEYQVSLTVSIGCSLPIAPAGKVVTTRVPSHSTPSTICLPSCSVLVVYLAALLEAGAWEGSSSSSVKLKVRMPWTLTGAPESSVGLNSHWRAASSAASRSSGCPLMTLASITSPVSLMIICTCTGPEALAAFAIGGYGG